MPRNMPTDLKTSITPWVMLTPYNFKYFDKSQSTPRYNQNLSEIEPIVFPAPESGIINNLAHTWETGEGLVGGQGGTSRFFLPVIGDIAKDLVGKMGSLARPFKQDKFINDFASLTYNGAEFREFSFTWSFIPQSDDEAKKLETILNDIQYTSVPNYYSSVVLKAPSFWIVEVMLSPDKQLFKIKECVLINYSCNYQPDGILTVFRSGHPVKVQLDLSFKELKRLGKGDLKKPGSQENYG